MSLKDKTICIYGGASERAPQEHKDLAKQLGEAVGQAGANLIFGGGSRGLMGAYSKAAQANGAHVMGVITEFLVEMEVANTQLNELIIVETMHTRKQIMMDRGEAFVIMPGGFGTLEEVMEVVTLKQLGQLDKPIIFANFGGYWDGLIEVFDGFEAQNYLHNRFEDLYTMADNLNQVMDQLHAGFTQPSKAKALQL